MRETHCTNTTNSPFNTKLELLVETYINIALSFKRSSTESRFAKTIFIMMKKNAPTLSRTNKLREKIILGFGNSSYSEFSYGGNCIYYFKNQPGTTVNPLGGLEPASLRCRLLPTKLQRPGGEHNCEYLYILYSLARQLVSVVQLVKHCIAGPLDRAQPDRCIFPNCSRSVFSYKNCV